MARTKDRHIISEAVRQQKLWRIEDIGKAYHCFHTAYDEQLEVYYGTAGQIRYAEYIHWDSANPSRGIVGHELIEKRKRERVLELLTQKDVDQ